MQQSSGVEASAWLWHEHDVRTPWNGLHKDVDLWTRSGDCLVYFYSRGGSARPASLQVSRNAMATAGCTDLLAMLDDASMTSTGISWLNERKAELFLGAPKHFGRDATFRWHLTTRNFFAWLLRKPLAGPHLGTALSDVLDRMMTYRPAATSNLDDLLDFADEMGYTYVANQPAYATAMLVFAEEQRLKDLWINAFSHCVGMCESLASTPDFDVLGNVNRALITKASLQQDIDLDAKCHAIETLLEDDFAAHLGLPSGAQQQLIDFRSFLQAHFVAAHGYWPPNSEKFSKTLYSSMLEDFECLFDLVADFCPFDKPRSRKATTTRLGVQHHLARFDERHGFASLDTQQPLLPNVGNTTQKPAYQALRGMLPSRTFRATGLVKAKEAFLVASNSRNHSMPQNPLAEAFLDFETESMRTADVAPTGDDARRVRWILIYGMLQMLHSVLRASPIVKDQDDASYPLCCNISKMPDWDWPKTSWHSAHGPLSLLNDEAASLPGTPMSVVSEVNVDGDSDSDQSDIHPALRRILPLRTKSCTESSTPPEALLQMVSRTAAEFSTTEDSPRSEMPSLDWGQESRSSHDSSNLSEDYDNGSLRKMSMSSSVYSDRIEQPLAPELPVKSSARGDVVDKGLAFDDFICPGLY